LKFEKRETQLDHARAILEQQARVLSKAKHRFLVKEAERKHFEAKLIQAASGRSHAERLINAQATEDWLRFQKDLARKEAIFDFQKLKYDLLDKEWLAQYQANKLDDSLIKRQVGA
jgi:hypothetical protein